jgi:hypothetical protein
MPGLTLNSNGTNRIFRPDGKVVVADDAGTETEHGTWRSDLSSDSNRIRYQFDEEEEAEFDVQYSFNGERNQLVAMIPADANGGADSEPFTFQGIINIDDSKDITYVLLDEAGSATENAIFVHGNLSFASGLDKLTIELAGGGMAEIQGDNFPAKSADVEESSIEDRDRDKLTFAATTNNIIDDADWPEPATILLFGRWDVNQDGLVFRASAKNGEISVQFGARYKGVTAGLAYFAKDGDQQVAFFIKGEHQFKGGGGANWEVSLGYSAAKIEAKGSLSVVRNFDGDRKLTISGDIHFVKAGEHQEFKLSVDAKYEIKNGEIVFSADVSSDGGELEYNLKLEGKYRLKNGEVSFLVEVGKDGDEQKLNINLSAEFGNDRARGSLNVIIQRTPSGEINAEVNLEVSVHWLGGELVPVGDPELLAA